MCCRIENGHVYRNGVRESDSYIAPCGAQPECTFKRPIKVPQGMYYMMGDNRGDSDDSRYWGPVPQKWIIGVAFFTYWPLEPDRDVVARPTVQSPGPIEPRMNASTDSCSGLM